MQQRIMQQKSFWDRGGQYYVTGRFAVAAGLNPVAGNLLHHAVEFLLKGALSKTQTLDDLRKYSHKLPQLWEVFKAAIGDAALGRFDPAIAALHAFEDLRYPDDALKNGMASTISSHRFLAGNAGLPLPPGLPPEISADIARRRASLPKVRAYELCLQDVDELVEAIFAAAKTNPRLLSDGKNPRAVEVLVEGNLAAGLLK
jgi:hypothetical protein